MISAATPEASQSPLPERPTDCRTKAVRHLNDAFRIGGLGGRFMVTPGVHQLPASTINTLVQAVRNFKEFTPDNDPYGEHDFGSVEIAGTTFFWKIDAYDLLLNAGFPDPTDPTITHRVLTIMRADEY